MTKYILFIGTLLCGLISTQAQPYPNALFAPTNHWGALTNSGKLNAGGTNALVVLANSNIYFLSQPIQLVPGRGLAFAARHTPNYGSARFDFQLTADGVNWAGYTNDGSAGQMISAITTPVGLLTQPRLYITNWPASLFEGYRFVRLVNITNMSGTNIFFTNAIISRWNP